MRRNANVDNKYVTACAILMLVACIIISWATTTITLFLIADLFGLRMTIKIATGFWLLLKLLKAFFATGGTHD